MKAIILAAGIGKRLRPITNSIPKPMIKIYDKPILEYIVNDLVNFGFDEICIVIGYNGNQIKKYFGSGDKFNAKISYVIQKEYKGTAYAVMCAKDFVGYDKFLLHLGDAINPDALKEHVNDMLGGESDIDIISTKIDVSKAKYVGNIKTSGDYIVKITEKSPQSTSNLSWAGVALFKDNRIFKKISELNPSNTGEYEITEAINNTLSEGTVVKNHICKKSIDVGTPKGVKKAWDWKKEQIQKNVR